MSDPFGLQRFVEAQDDGGTYDQAMRELRAGAQAQPLDVVRLPAGRRASAAAPMAQHYAISGLAEARAYLAHPVLGRRLVECARALTELDTADPERVFGPVDAQKLRSSMTLFAARRARRAGVPRRSSTSTSTAPPDDATTSRL